MNQVEQYLAKAAGVKTLSVGQEICVDVSLVVAHDVTGPMAIAQFEEIGIAQVFDPSKLVMVADHVYPAPTPNARKMQLELRRFCKEYGATLYDRGQGVIHQIIAENHRLKPGEIVVGADSHTCTAGGYGAIGIGVGATELAAAMATGKIDMEVPPVLQVCLHGKQKPGVFGKDLILALAKEFGTNGLTDKALLFSGEGMDHLSEEERMTVCNMGIELGATFTLFGKREPEPASLVWQTMDIHLPHLEPLAACPFSPGNIQAVQNLGDIEITQVVVGSCTNGRINDMEEVYKAVKGKCLPEHVNMIVVPASIDVLEQMESKGYVKAIRDAGAVIVNPGCGPCYGGHLGLAAEEDVVVSTTNRNFPGRMGHKNARIYLTSPAVAAASALLGKITVPEVYLG